MTVGFHAPLPPVHSGVADYATRLLTELRKRGTIVVNAPDADVHLYHLGNNQLHRAIYNRAIHAPGVVVLHDAVLHHFYLGALNEKEYETEYAYNYGDWERPLSAELWRERAGSGSDSRYFRRPMLKRITEHARAVIVHNPEAARLAREHTPNAQIIQIPHFYDGPGPPEEAERQEVRERWNIDPQTYVFGVFGFLRESKRLLTILRCFKKLHASRPATRLIVAGEWASQDLQRATAGELTQDAIIYRPFLPEREFWKMAAAVDCCLNLRHPSAGETSGIGVRLMGIGKPVFFSDSREIEAIPMDACVRITPGVEETRELFDYMNIVAALPQISREIGARAAAHIRREHCLRRIADLYWNTLCAHSAA